MVERQIINTLVKCVACLGGKSDILGTISSWKDSLPESEVFASLQSWLDETLKGITNPEIVEFCKK